MRCWMGRVGMGGIGAKGFLEQKSVTFKGHDRGVGILLYCFGGLRIRVLAGLAGSWPDKYSALQSVSCWNALL